jgi:hypothetical protein
MWNETGYIFLGQKVLSTLVFGKYIERFIQVQNGGSAKLT